MKLIHIADTHLGLAAFNRLDPESGMNLREKQVYDNFLKAIDEIIQQKPDVLVHAGDLFDVVKPKTRAYTTVLEALDRLHAAGIPFIVIAGNHSMVKTRYTTSPYEVLTYHPSRITAAYKFRYEQVEIGDTVFHLIPNMLRVEDYRTAFDQIELAPSGYHNVLVTHGLATAIKDKRLATVAEHAGQHDPLGSVRLHCTRALPPPVPDHGQCLVFGVDRVSHVWRDRGYQGWAARGSRAA